MRCDVVNLLRMYEVIKLQYHEDLASIFVPCPYIFCVFDIRFTYLIVLQVNSLKLAQILPFQVSVLGEAASTGTAGISNTFQVRASQSDGDVVASSLLSVRVDLRDESGIAVPVAVNMKSGRYEVSYKPAKPGALKGVMSVGSHHLPLHIQITERM